ncbi:hypothetical protein [Tumebacillus flagellatus]|uniref:Fimbrial assembly protein n=1 Tax=Tumebacillus flagellatus TaxID=1157490 RepID=A0A074LKN1_9BACL|nr:hypothetical protein [Tumebacillus flagellatus]KEO82691.1 hypothetical protein EL26_14085 [Tumebacillus flagellatus]
MEINLLPKESPTKKYRMLAWLAAAVLLLGGVGSTLVGYIHLVTTESNLQAQLNRVKADNTALAAERTVDSRTQKYNQVRGAVDKLIAEQNDYGQMLDDLSAKLSEHMQVEQLTVDTGKQSLDLKLRTDDASKIEEYAALLRHEVWVSDLTILNIQEETSEPALKSFTAQLTVALKPKTAQQS